MESKAPDHVNLVYRKVGKTHVIASKGIVGLVHVAHHDLAAAVRNAMTALSTHISRVYGTEVRYVLDADDNIDMDRQDVDIGMIGARLDHEQNACH